MISRQTSQIDQSSFQETPGINALVYKVFLNVVDTPSTAAGFGPGIIGAIQYRDFDDRITPPEELPIAFPYDSNYKTLPLENESVEILTRNGLKLYKRVGIDITPNANEPLNQISRLYKPLTDDNQGTTEEYNQTSQTGISNTTDSSSTNESDKYGEYFEVNKKIKKLSLNEGDSLIESRFGQSLRFSGFNNPNRNFAPVTILRNGERLSTQNGNVFSTTEDVNRDGSIILLGSGQYKLPFQPGTIDENGTSDFSTTPVSFGNYPSELLGDQILINSGRIILSAKNAEMIFYSKKNYGFISDGALSIDNLLGIDVNVSDDINVTTNDASVNIISGNGNINLGTNEVEPLVKGDTLVEILSELIDQILLQNYLTPSGPSKIEPENGPAFRSIKAKLKTILSQFNNTQ